VFFQLAVPGISVQRSGGVRTPAGLAAAKRMGRTGGRPAKLLDDDLDIARTLLANPDITVAEVADRLGVSPATLYRYLPAARSANSSP
jgi:DNA invertase Pin-like site-specific DNA recombinase